MSAAKLRSFCKNILSKREKKSINKISKLDVTMTPTTTTVAEPSPSMMSSPCSWTSSEVYSEEREFSGEIEKVFRYIDDDGDGKISPVDLRRCVKAVGVQRLTAEEAEMAVVSSDSDGDGLLSLADFERLMEGNGMSPEEKKEELKVAFEMYSDVKKDGSLRLCITPKSLKKMMSRLGEKKTVGECEGMIKVYDLNGDGVLSFDEFVKMMA